MKHTAGWKPAWLHTCLTDQFNSDILQSEIEINGIGWIMLVA